MPVHDWTRVEAGIFHAFHTAWVAAMQSALNGGLLPDGYYALAEQHAGGFVPEVVRLHVSPESRPQLPPLPPPSGGTAVAEAPPKVRRKQQIDATTLARRRTLAIRHVSGHRLVALVEIGSPANKDRATHVSEFVEKAVTTLERGVHLLLADLLPPGPHDPHGMHGTLVQRLGECDDPYDLPPEEPLTLAAYAAGLMVDIYLEHLKVGAELPKMPLFLTHDRYVDVPLEQTYQAAYRGMPAFWRDVLEGRPWPDA